MTRAISRADSRGKISRDYYAKTSLEFAHVLGLVLPAITRDGNAS